MNTYFKAACWSAAIVGVAVAGSIGVIDKDAAETLTITLPFVAWMAISGRTCRLPRRSV